MPTFKLTGMITISIYTEVEAETIDKAIKIAEDREVESTQFHSGEQQKEVWTSDEYDGEPWNINQVK